MNAANQVLMWAVSCGCIAVVGLALAAAAVQVGGIAWSHLSSTTGDLDGDGRLDILQKDFQKDRRVDIWLNIRLEPRTTRR